MMVLDQALDAKYRRLQSILSGMGSVLIGMSGGVDSVLLAAVANAVLGDRAVAVTADSPSLPRSASAPLGNQRKTSAT